MALRCLLPGWAQGVRKDTIYLHIPENGSWLLATGNLAAIGIVLLVWPIAAFLKVSIGSALPSDHQVFAQWVLSYL